MPPWWNKFEQYHNELEARAVDDQPLFICPIMKTIMLDPVVLSETGNTFERNAIEMWLSESNLDPQTSETLTEEPTLVPNRSLARQIRNWCEDTARTMSAEYESDSGSQVILTKSHVFVDASNILINPPRPLSDKILIDFLRACGRDVVEAHVAGSRSLQRQPWLSAKYKIHHDNRRGPERFVDDVLIAQALATAQKSFDPPRLLVLCTGDGNLNQGRTNFPVVVQTALASRSWEVELITWRVKMNKCYYKFQKHYPDRFFIRFLEDVLDDDEPATAPR